MGFYNLNLHTVLVGIVSLFNLYAMSEYECKYFWQLTNPQDNESQK